MAYCTTPTAPEKVYLPRSDAQCEKGEKLVGRTLMTLPGRRGSAMKRPRRYIVSAPVMALSFTGYAHDSFSLDEIVLVA